MSSDEQSDKECPLCMEPLEIDDINFYPCKCEYQICRFCWHRLRTDENGLCPACRQPYPEDPVNFKPLTVSDVQKMKSEKKQKQQQQRIKSSESRKHLSSYRVLQKNLVYVVGLSARVADAEILKKAEYFGKYGRIMKVAVGSSSSSNGPQSATCTAYVTYARYEDALRAIQSVNNALLDGRVVKASLGTTKYCSSFLRSVPCHKPECMYLHDVADNEVSFTKDDMHLGRHAEYEKKLIEMTLLKDKGFRGRAFPISGSRRKHSQSKSGDRGGLIISTNMNGGDKVCSKEAATSSVQLKKSEESEKSHDALAKESVVNASSSLQTERPSGTDTAQNGFSTDNEHVNASQDGDEEVKKSAPPRSVESTERSAVSSDGLESKAVPVSDDSQQPADQRSRLLQWTSAEGNVVEAAKTCDTVERSLSKDKVSQAEVEADPGPEPAVTDAPAACDWQRVLGLNAERSSRCNGTIDNNDKQTSAHSDLQHFRNYPSWHSVHSDDDLGFDPFSESAKGLADLLEEEKATPIPRHPSSSVPSAPSLTSSLMSLGLHGWGSVGMPGSSSLDSSFAPGVEPPRTNNYFPPAFGTRDAEYYTSATVRATAAGQPQQHTLYTPSNHSPHVYEVPSSKAQLTGMQFSEPPPGLTSLYQQQRYASYASTTAVSPVTQSPTPADANQLNEWQEGLKALLPNVNVRFVSDLSSSGYPASRASVSSPGSWQPPNQQQLSLLNCYGQAPSQPQQVTPSLSTPLSMLSLNSLSQPVPQWMPPPPGFSHLSKR